MKVLLISFHLPLNHEPGAFRPWMEARLMHDLGCTVTVITSAIQYMTGEDLRSGKQGWCTEEQREGIRILRVWGLRNYRVGIWRRLLHYGIYAVLAGLAVLRRVGEADRIFVGTDPVFVTPVARIMARIKGADLVLDERDLYPETALALGILKPGILSRLVSAWQRSLRKSAGRILSATPGIRVRLLELGVPAEDVRVLYNADAYLGAENRDPVYARQMLEHFAPHGSKFIVVYAGGMGRANDVGTLLDAAEILRNNRKIGFVLAGDGEYRLDFERRIRDAHLNAALTGPLPRDVARQIILGASACAHMYHKNPLFSGALASKILDYMGLGKPIVFCGEGDTVEVIRVATGGICCPSGDAKGMADAFRWLLDHPEQRVRMGESAHKWFMDNASKKTALTTMAWALDFENAT